MKQQIVGYVTALIDMNRSTVNMSIKNCLDNLLEFVIDIPKENKETSIAAFNTALENENLKQSNAKLLSRVMELEESCENMNEIENNLHKRVKALTENNDALDENCNKLINHNSKLIKINLEIFQCNKNQAQMIQKLRKRNKSLINAFKY
ncbi:MAG: Na+/phosphate symporter [Clostridium sp.]|jgi:Na+/phosphate symporter